MLQMNAPGMAMERTERKDPDTIAKPFSWKKLHTERKIMFSKIQKALPNKNWKTTLAFSPGSKLERANTKREIPKKTAEEVKKRDMLCIIPKCGMPIDEIHHAFYGIDADYSAERNDAINLVWLCKWCHDKLHSRWNNEYREYCKNYLKNIWKS